MFFCTPFFRIILGWSSIFKKFYEFGICCQIRTVKCFLQPFAKLSGSIQHMFKYLAVWNRFPDGEAVARDCHFELNLSVSDYKKLILGASSALDLVDFLNNFLTR